MKVMTELGTHQLFAAHLPFSTIELPYPTSGEMYILQSRQQEHIQLDLALTLSRTYPELHRIQDLLSSVNRRHYKQIIIL